MLPEAQAKDIVGECVSFKTVSYGILVARRVLPFYKSERREDELLNVEGTMSMLTV